ncbi:hypothetical protein [Paenibacillus sp. MMS18-CY102]|uniref:hypothetical protein n=1 Tax=Paenibacillus sp. MMS18-CY102 TaxID=2682849 RepID=UPI0013654DDD|nr:hypothetical protein [Paenibacillus sp. MMS18-CY102]MWC29028.1 hypothetical protein [Paenibacillus sp. MMS18-CY102]
METFQIQQITLADHSEATTIELALTSAELVLITEHGSKLWYIDVTGAGPASLLDHYYSSEHILVSVTALAADGRTFQGKAYFHANVPKQACVLRGDDELIAL